MKHKLSRTIIVLVAVWMVLLVSGWLLEHSAVLAGILTLLGSVFVLAILICRQRSLMGAFWWLWLLWLLLFSLAWFSILQASAKAS